MKYLIIAAALMASACVPEPDKMIDPKLKTHVDAFVTEAKNHGVDIDVYNLDIRFADLSSQGAAGGVTTTGAILIDSASINWYINPEAVVFHEMGHKYLHRDHMDEMFPLENLISLPKPKSVMHSHFLYLYSQNRAYYMDELFNGL